MLAGSLSLKAIGQETPAKKIVVFNHLATHMSVYEKLHSISFAVFLKYLRYITKDSYLNASSW